MRHLHTVGVPVPRGVRRSAPLALPRRSTRSSCCRARTTRSAPPGPDALDSARAVAARYGADGRVRELASGVVPVAGLIAETGATLREAHFRWFRDAGRPDRGPSRRPPALRRTGSAIRPEPARRGRVREDPGAARHVRPAARRAAPGRWRGRDLDGALGPPRAIRNPRAPAHARRRYGRRAQALKARSALAARGSSARSPPAWDRGRVGVVVSVDRLEASSQDLALFRLLHLVLTGVVDSPPRSARRSTGCAGRRRPGNGSGSRPTPRPPRSAAGLDASSAGDPVPPAR